MRANVPPRQSRKARIKVTGMLIKETSLRYHDFATLCLKLIKPRDIKAFIGAFIFICVLMQHLTMISF